MKCYSSNWLINTVFHLRIKGELKRERGFITLFPWKEWDGEGGGLIREGGVGGTRGYCYFRAVLCWSHHLVHLSIHKMKKISDRFPQGALTITIFCWWALFAGMALKTWKKIAKLQFMSIPAICRNRRQQTVSMLQWPSIHCTIIFEIPLTRRHVIER